MASKWAHLRGKVPIEKTERQQEVEARIAEWGLEPLQQLTARYNKFEEEKKALAAKVKLLNVDGEALEVLIQGGLDTLGGDGIKGMNGYTWSQKFEPYPIAEDPAAIVKYFEDHGMADQLTLTTSELASRLKGFVKAEAENNELQIEMKTVEGPDGKDVEVPEVRSQIPGVKVFLKSGLSRVKSGKGA